MFRPSPQLTLLPDKAPDKAPLPLNLAGQEFTGETFKGLDFSQAILTETRFSDCHFINCVFTGADLTGAQMVGGAMESSLLNDLTWPGGELYNFILGDSPIIRANLSRTFFLNVKFLNKAGLVQVNLTKAFIQKCEGMGLVIESSDLTGAIIRDSNFSSLVIKNSNLTRLLTYGLISPNFKALGLDLTQAAFWRADLSRAVLTGATLNQAKFMESLLIEADLSKALANKAIFQGSNLTRANLTGLKAQLADFSRAILAEAQLEEGDFRLVNLHRTLGLPKDHLTADFTGARPTDPRLARAEGFTAGQAK